MNERVRRPFTVVCVVALGLVLWTGCGSQTAPNASEAAAAPEAGWAAATQRAMAHEQLIAACMRSRGWDYMPHLPVDFVLQEEEVRAAAEHRDPRPPEELSLPVDPNEQIVAGLSSGEQEDRAAAYWGNLDQGGREPGCYRGTYEEAWGVDPFAAEAQPDAMDLEQQALADPRVRTANAAYVECMKASGVDVSGFGDVLTGYIRASESLSARESASGASEETRAARERLTAAWQRQSRTHRHCAPAYEDVFDTVLDELRVETGVWP